MDAGLYMPTPKLGDCTSEVAVGTSDAHDVLVDDRYCTLRIDTRWHGDGAPRFGMREERCGSKVIAEGRPGAPAESSRHAPQLPVSTQSA